jgi:DNA replication protein DnaC
MSANRTYQQLRSHLAYLKLEAAADALTPVLDEAGEATHVEVLERLLAIEVEATATRRRESRRRLAGLPADCPLADFDTDAQPSITPELLRDLATRRFVDKGGNVLFIAPPGVGKTMRQRMSTRSVERQRTSAVSGRTPLQNPGGPVRLGIRPA